MKRINRLSSWSVVCLYACIFALGTTWGRLIDRPWWWGLVSAFLWLLLACYLMYRAETAKTTLMKKHVDDFTRIVEGENGNGD